MKYRLFISLIIIGIFVSAQSFPQDKSVIKDYDHRNFNFIGAKKGKTIYQYNPFIGSSSEIGDRFDLYYAVRSPEGKVNFHLYKTCNNYIYYMHDDYTLLGKSHPDSIFLRKHNDEIVSISKIGEMNLYRRTHYSTQGDCFYFAIEIGGLNYLTRIDFKQENPKMEVLPIKGKAPILLDNWLYYTIAYETSKHYVSSASSIYRIKVDDYRKPELLVNNVNFGGPVINKKLLSFKVYHRDEWRKVTYDITDSTYIEKPISSLIKYKGKKYQRTLCNKSNKGKTQLCFQEVPELPEEFPHKLERDIEPNHNYLSLPHTQKPFTGTFITDSLMFFAGKGELENMSKAQLRKLRNAFYAREGYDFNSTDLQEFFSQFDWYEKTLERRKAYDMTNDDIYMPPANIERIKLIRSVEKSK